VVHHYDSLTKKETGNTCQDARFEGIIAKLRDGRLWLNDGSCVRLRPEYPGHVWFYGLLSADA